MGEIGNSARGRPSRPGDDARRFFEALDPRAAAPPKRRRWYALPFFVAALVAVAIARAVVMRVLLPVVLVAVALALMLKRPLRERRAPTRPRRGLAIDSKELSFSADESTVPMLSLVSPFGVTLVTTPRRDRLVAVLSSPSGAYFVGALLDEATRDELAPLLVHASTVASEDAALEAVGPDGEPLLIAASDLAALVDALESRSPSCLDRIMMTDARGAAITLDARTLTLGERTLDLTAPLEWRSIVFQEAFGAAVAIYQGTWVRQNATEIVLVSLLPSLAPPHSGTDDLAALDRAAIRDLRLMQASPEEPPPQEQRIAIDRLFMMPLRSALDKAPRRSHQPNAAQA